MAIPLRVLNNEDLRICTDSDEQYILYQMGLELAAGTTTTVGALTTSSADSATNIGTLTNTFYNQPIGAHPGDQITSSTTTTTLYQRIGSVTEETSTTFRYPVMWDSDLGGVKEMTDSNLNDTVDRLLGTLLTNDYPGTFRLADTSPGAGWSVHLSNVFSDTQATNGIVTNYNIYKRTSDTIPTTVRPVKIKRAGNTVGGAYEGLQEMSDTEIRRTLGRRAQNRIPTNGIGKYQIRSGTQGAPTDPGTWVVKGTATDTLPRIIEVEYPEGATYASPLYAGVISYEGPGVEYTNENRISYDTYLATRIYTSDLYLVATATNYTGAYTSDIEVAVYQADYAIDYTTDVLYVSESIYQTDFAVRYTTDALYISDSFYTLEYTGVTPTVYTGPVYQNDTYEGPAESVSYGSATYDGTLYTISYTGPGPIYVIDLLYTITYTSGSPGQPYDTTIYTLTNNYTAPVEYILVTPGGSYTVTTLDGPPDFNETIVAIYVAIGFDNEDGFYDVEYEGSFIGSYTGTNTSFLGPISSYTSDYTGTIETINKVDTYTTAITYTSDLLYIEDTYTSDSTYTLSLLYNTIYATDYTGGVFESETIGDPYELPQFAVETYTLYCRVA